MKWNFMCRHEPYTIKTFTFIQVQFPWVPKVKSQTTYLDTKLQIEVPHFSYSDSVFHIGYLSHRTN